MKVSQTTLPGVLLIEPRKFADDRGFFSEVFKEEALAEAGFAETFMQDNHAYSADAGVLRGLHYQRPPFAQDKLVRVVRGAIYDVAVDIREGSPTFGQWMGIELSAANWKQLLVPKGFAHGYLTLEPDTEVLYKVTNPYSPESDTGILWNDPTLGIDWPLQQPPILSEKDTKQPLLSEITTEFTF